MTHGAVSIGKNESLWNPSELAGTRELYRKLRTTRRPATPTLLAARYSLKEEKGNPSRSLTSMTTLAQAVEPIEFSLVGLFHTWKADSRGQYSLASAVAIAGRAYELWG